MAAAKRRALGSTAQANARRAVGRRHAPGRVAPDAAGLAVRREESVPGMVRTDSRFPFPCSAALSGWPAETGASGYETLAAAPTPGAIGTRC